MSYVSQTWDESPDGGDDQAPPEGPATAGDAAKFDRTGLADVDEVLQRLDAQSPPGLAEHVDRYDEAQRLLHQILTDAGQDADQQNPSGGDSGAYGESPSTVENGT